MKKKWLDTQQQKVNTQVYNHVLNNEGFSFKFPLNDNHCWEIQNVYFLTLI